MEILASFVAAIVREAGRSCFAPLCSTIKGARQFRRDEWESVVNDLLDLRRYVKNQVESAVQDGRSPAPKVRKWIKEVSDFEADALEIRSRLARENRRLCGCDCLLKLQAARMMAKAERLLDEGIFPTGMLTNWYLAKRVEHMPGPSIKDETSASRTLALVMEKLEDSKIHRIGVWGLGGVGKTTLVKNLNNKLLNTTSNKQFSIVIWVTVSREFDLKRVQMKIAERLNLELKSDESVERIASRLYERLKHEKFLLILDDVWKNIELDQLGIPQDELAHLGAKIVLTSRSLEVCRGMMTDDVVKMNTLNDKEAWELFKNKVGEVAILRTIEPFAQAVARECCGLPLALVTVGTSMRGKSAVELWKHALKELQTLVDCIDGSRDKVYNSLKWSYEALEGKRLKSCFLFCALYPEDSSIEISQLIQCWLGEGLMEKRQSLEESGNNAIAMVQSLKDSCLLEDGDHEGSVKMHDIVRDVAIWIASVEVKGKSLCRSGMALSEIMVSELQDALTRVSFANNEITKLPDEEPRCSKVLTLLLQGNLLLEQVHENFMRSFQELRVLSLCKTRIKELSSILQLSNLRSLLLADCVFLEELKGLGALEKLEVLDLRATRIKELPRETENLVNLRQVNLSRTHYLKQIPAWIISKWACLEALEMTLSGYQWGVEEEGQASFNEFSFLKRLASLSIRLKLLPNVYSMYSCIIWMREVRRFQLFIGDATNSLPSIHDKRRVIISNADVTEEWIAWFMINSTSLVLNSCSGLGLTFSRLETYWQTMGGGREFEGLKSLTITASTCELNPREDNAYHFRDLLPNLEDLRLHNLHNLTSITELASHLGLLFSRLKLIEVVNCNHMKYLLSYGNEIITLPSLEILKVSFCTALENLFIPLAPHKIQPRRLHSNISSREIHPVVPNLKTLELLDLPKLKSLCKLGESWSRLERIVVYKCFSLKKLPLTIQNAKTIKTIQVESIWWKSLEWDEDITCRGVQQFCEYRSLRERRDTPTHLAGPLKFLKTVMGA